MSDDTIDEGRRKFLKTAGLAGTTAAAAPLVTGAAEAREPEEEQIKSRYRMNEHVKRYYMLNRL